MKKLTYFFYPLIIAVMFSISCKSSEPDSQTSKTYDISDFTTLSLAIVGEVVYEQSDSLYLNVSGSSTLIEDLQVSDRGGKLSVELKNMKRYSNGKKELVVRVGSPNLETIIFDGVGTLQIPHRFQGEKLSITNNGVGHIKIDDCHVTDFNLTSRSVGSVEAKGTATETSILSEGIGKIDFSDFKSENTKVVSKGTGNLSVYAQKSIDISLSGIGNIKYYGNPENVKTDISGVGKITKM